MKKTVFFIVAGLLALTGFAQTDLATAIKTIGEDVQYSEYWNVQLGDGGKNIISEKRWVVTLKSVMNRFGKFAGFDGIDTKEPGKKRIEYYYMYYTLDHYTHPAYMLNENGNVAHMIINGVLFQLTDFKGPESFTIDKMWFPKVPKDRAKDPIFQGSGMGDMKSADLKKLIRDYLAGMKKIQDANPYSEQVQTEADAMVFSVDSTRIMWNQKNAAYWNSPEGKAKLASMQKPKVTVYNDTQGEVLMCYGQGAYTVLKPGQKKTFSCDDGKIYKGKHRENSQQLDSTGEVLLNLDGNNCGTTINASTLH